MTKFTKNDIYFIETALNAYWNENARTLQRKDAGDIERTQAETSMARAAEIMGKIGSPNFNWEDYSEEK